MAFNPAEYVNSMCSNFRSQQKSTGDVMRRKAPRLVSCREFNRINQISPVSWCYAKFLPFGNLTGVCPFGAEHEREPDVYGCLPSNP